MIFAIGFTGCFEEETTCFRCVYEERSTTGCSGSSYGPWESGESTADTEDIRSDLTREEYCDLVYPSSDTECGGGCCVSFQFRNVRVESCP